MVWVADRGGHRVQKFDSEGNFLLEFGSDGKGEGEFSHPRQVAVVMHYSMCMLRTQKSQYPKI
jgi:hypothetical protein